MVFFDGGEPHFIVCRLIALISQNEDKLPLDVDRDATKHGAGHR